jgi:hypothetical protein
MLAPPTAPEDDPQLADVGTDAPGLEPPELAIGASNEVEPENPSVEEVVRDEPEPAAETQPKPKKKKRTQKRTVGGARAATEAAAATETGKAATAGRRTATGAAGANAVGEDAVSDDGIDWSVPDFPQEALAVPGVAPSAPEPPRPPSKPRPPTGTPDVPAQNPVVIDEPPSR